MGRRTTLVTGAAGGVAGMLVPALAGKELRLVDRVRPDPEALGEIESGGEVDVRIGDLADRAFAAEVVDGIDTVIHLAANPAAPAAWDDLRVPNVEAVAVIYQAAQRAGVRRVVFASSVHAAGGHVQMERHPVDPAWPPWPCCTYGATKAFGEALGRTYAYRTGLSVVCLRFGGVQPRPWSVGSLASWLGPADLRQLVLRAADADVAFGVYHGISANSRGEWSIANARAELGYEPECQAEDHLADLNPDPARGLCAPGPLTLTTSAAEEERTR